MFRLVLLLLVFFSTEAWSQIGWVELTKPDSYEFYDVQFIDKDTGFACGDTPSFNSSNCDFYSTYDGGITWKKHTFTLPREGRGIFRIKFYNSQEGIIAGSISGWPKKGPAWIARTTNGGDTWEEFSLGSNVGNPADIAITYGNTIFIPYSGYYVQSEQKNAYGGHFAYSTDRGETWEVRSIHNTSDPDPNSVYYFSNVRFVSPLKGYLVLSISGNFNATIQIGETKDAGRTWNFRNIITDVPNDYGIKCFDQVSDNIWCASTGGSIFRSNDNMKTWKKIVDKLSFDRIEFVDSLTAFAISYNTIWKTTNSGYTWTPQYSDSLFRTRSLFVKDTSLAAVSGVSKILKTDDGGWKLSVDDFTSIEQVSDIALNPNPAMSYIRISNIDSRQLLRIFDMLGNPLQVSYERVGPEVVTCDVSKLSDGVYSAVIGGRTFRFTVVR